MHLWRLLRAGFWFALSSTDKKMGTCLTFFFLVSYGNTRLKELLVMETVTFVVCSFG